MSAAVSIAGSSAVETSLQGLNRSGQRLQGAAETVVGASLADAATGGTDTQDTVTISDAARRARGQGSLEQGLINGKVAGLVYTANARVVAGSTEATGTLMSILA